MSMGTPGGFGGGGYGPPPGAFGGGPPPGAFGGGPPPGAFGGFTPPSAGGPGPAGAPIEFGATDPLSFAWRCAQKDFVTLVLPILVATFAASLLSAIVGGVISAFGVVLIAMLDLEPEYVQIAMQALRLPANVLGGLIGLFFTCGITVFSLKVARGEKPEFTDVFSGFRFYLPMLVAGIVSNLLVGTGLLLCIVPGMIIALGLCLTNVVIVDRQLGPIEALKESWRLTTGFKVPIFLHFLVLFGATLVGLLLCCLPAIVVGALAPIALAYIYLLLNGEEPRIHGAV